MDPEPPAGYAVRAATLEDAHALAELLNACTMAEAGVAWTSEPEMREDLGAPGFDLDNDTALVLDQDGRLVAGLVLYPDGEPVADVLALGLVRPDAWGRGLGTFVTILGERRARNTMALVPATGRFTVHGSRFLSNDDAARLFQDLGYTCTRTWWRMTIDLDDEIPTVSLPPGVALVPFVPERDSREVFDALREAFRDHWGEGMRGFDDWIHRVSGVEGSSTRFVLAPREGDQIAGALVGRAGTGDDPSAGVVEELGVRRPWRGRGLGLALLRMALAEFRRRGLERARLTVDSESPTGASRLYERAGMRIELAWDRWEKELRPGEV
jgi:mycothiol synthase